MYVAVLRVSGRTFDPDRFARQYELVPDVVWHAGELGPGGRVRPESGFNLAIAEVASPAALVPEVRAWLERQAEAVRALRDADVGATVDVGVSVGDDPQLTVSVTLSSADMAAFAEAGVAFRVSAYPTRDE